MSVYSLTIRNRALAAILAIVVLGAGAALLVVGIALFAALAVAGGVLGAGLIAYRALRGRRAAPGMHRRTGLDPSLEIFPEQGALAEPLESAGPNEQLRRPGE